MCLGSQEEPGFLTSGCAALSPAQPCQGWSTPAAGAHLGRAGREDGAAATAATAVTAVPAVTAATAATAHLCLKRAGTGIWAQG